MHFYSWKSGLKTGMYYLRSRPAVDAIKFTVNVEELLKATEGKDANEVLKVFSKYEHPDEKKVETVITSNISDTKYEKKEEEGCISCSG